MARTKCYNCKKTIKKEDKVIRYNLGQSNLKNPLVHLDCDNPTGKLKEVSN